MTEALVIVTPFEVVKIRLQQQQGAKGAQLKYRGTLGTFSTIAREEGLRGLWSGATPTVMRNGTNQACLFWAKNNMDKVLWGKHEGDGRVLLPWQSMVSGFTAACLGPMVTNPFDVAKTRLMAQGGAAADVPKYRGFFDCIFQVGRSEGPLALYKGLAWPLAAQGLYKAVMFGVYGAASRALRGGDAAPHLLKKLSAIEEPLDLRSYTVLDGDVYDLRKLATRHPGAFARVDGYGNED